MILCDSKAGANAWCVRIFLAEKGIDMEMQQLDLEAGENNAVDYLRRNPMGKMSLLELDNATYIAESIAIYRYLEALYPTPLLFANYAKQKGKNGMCLLCWSMSFIG